MCRPITAGFERLLAAFGGTTAAAEFLLPFLGVGLDDTSAFQSKEPPAAGAAEVAIDGYAWALTDATAFFTDGDVTRGARFCFLAAVKDLFGRRCQQCQQFLFRVGERSPPGGVVHNALQYLFGLKNLRGFPAHV